MSTRKVNDLAPKIDTGSGVRVDPTRSHWTVGADHYNGAAGQLAYEILKRSLRCSTRSKLGNSDECGLF